MDARARRALTEARAGPRWGAGVGGAGREVALGARGRRGDSGALAAHVKPHFRRRGGLRQPPPSLPTRGGGLHQAPPTVPTRGRDLDQPPPTLPTRGGDLGEAPATPPTG